MLDPKNISKEEARALLKRLGFLKSRRSITGEEREKVFTMLRLVPCKSSNNQHLWTDTWIIGNITYNHHTGSGVDELEEVINEPTH